MRWWVTLAAGAVALVVGATVLLTARHLPSAFSASTPAVSTSAGTSVPTSRDTATTTPPSRSSSPAPVPSSPPPTTTAPVPAGPFQPTSLTLTAWKVTAPVDPVFTAAGVLNPPDDTSRVGWWGAGSLARSSAGTTVIVGHVDGPSGPGALYRLVHARAGDRITVAGSNGESIAYAVTSLQYHGKGDPLPTSLFDHTGPPRLVLISCGGPFDRSDDQYEDNVVVQASPA